MKEENTVSLAVAFETLLTDGYASLSADGRYIAFESDAANLLPGDSNNFQDVYLWDRVARLLQRVSLANNGAQADQDCWLPILTADVENVALPDQPLLAVPGWLEEVLLIRSVVPATRSRTARRR